MFTKLAQYTCVLTCLIWSSPCFGGPATGRNDSGNTAEQSKTLLTKALDTNEEIYANLRSFVCNEEIQRFKGPLSSATGKQIDTVTATVSFENGTEHYSDIRQNSRPRPRMSSLAGAWSEGEFGTLLRQTEALLGAQAPVFENYEDLDGSPAFVYEMIVAANDSPWDLEVRSQHFRLPFRTKVWVSAAGGEILKIERISTVVPAQMGISEIRWNVTLKEVDLNGRTWLLPSTGEYIVSYEETGHHEWNVMRFSNYRRYGSEVAIRFE